MTTNEQTFTVLPPSEAKAKIDADEAQVLDVRAPNDYGGGHVPGALNLPLQSVRSRGEYEMLKDKDLIFIDTDGQRAPQACETAASLGFERVFMVEGGIEGWLKAGYEVQAYT